MLFGLFSKGKKEKDDQSSKGDGEMTDPDVRKFFKLLEEKGLAEGEDKIREAELKAAEFANTLSGEQKTKVAELLKGIEYVQAIEAHQKVVRSKLRTTLPEVIPAVGNPITRITGNTAEFALRLVGEAGAGIWRGGKATVDAFRQAA
ncbi:hypothetical protein KKF03_00405 [Patescibacteria group bacterium]|nr:hypothetical protein [Patescibacteria group bacterium]